jgi:hypothetical protein
MPVSEGGIMDITEFEIRESLIVLLQGYVPYKVRVNSSISELIEMLERNRPEMEEAITDHKQAYASL